MDGPLSEWIAGELGSIALALLAGAGGSALLELIWRPRRIKRRVARLLAAEIAMNTQLVALTAAMMKVQPPKMGPGFRVSMLVWDAARESVTELPDAELREVIALYGSYHEINRDAETIDALMDSAEGLEPNSSRRVLIQRQLIEVTGVLYDSVVRARDRGRGLITALRATSGQRGPDPSVKSDAEYEVIAQKLFEKRTADLKAALSQLQV